MPSSPSSTPKQQATRPPGRLQDLGQYRQTVYHDGAGRHIAESRRRPRAVRKLQPATTANPDWVLYPTNNASPSPYSRSANASRDYPSSVSSGKTGVAPHVTSAKRSSNINPKTIVIVDARQSTKIVADELKPSIQIPAVLTPPPTPKIERLPTPDFHDLDEAPFCNCGVEAHIVKFCTTCNKGY